MIALCELKPGTPPVNDRKAAKEWVMSLIVEVCCPSVVPMFLRLLLPGLYKKVVPISGGRSLKVFASTTDRDALRVRALTVLLLPGHVS